LNELLERIQIYLASRSARERWLGVLVVCVAAAILIQTAFVGPMRAELNRTASEVETLEGDLVRGERMAREIQRLQADLSLIEARIKPGEKTNLFTLLESLADEAAVKDRLESIKPKQPSGNDRYPETRVEVSIKGATLPQVVSYLYRIETAPVLLIVRSLRIKTKADGSNLLDVSFSVSSFERA